MNPCIAVANTLLLGPRLDSDKILTHSFSYLMEKYTAFMLYLFEFVSQMHNMP